MMTIRQTMEKARMMDDNDDDVHGKGSIYIYIYIFMNDATRVGTL